KSRPRRGARSDGDMGGQANMTRISVTVDGVAYSDEVENRTLLVQYLREQLGKTGTVIGCDTSNCGACTVHLDGRSIKACTMLAVQVDSHALQCGFCTPGMIMSSIDLLTENANPTEAEIREGLDGNLCRCTGYQNIVRAVQQVAHASAPAGASASIGASS